MSKPTGVVLWEGASPIDNAPIVAIGTFKSKNPKTGPMLQVWILRADVNPTQAVAVGQDRATCGDCALRPLIQRLAKTGQAMSGWRAMLRAKPCYVNVGQAPLAVWRSYKAGRYLRWQDGGGPFYGRKIRWGAYGDPALIPADVVHRINYWSDGWTGYTHQWRHGFASWAREVFMASTDTDADRLDAARRGWRTFHARNATDPVPEGSITCPASEEAGERTTCARCQLCNGARPSVASIVIIGH